MPPFAGIAPITNGESGGSVRAKLNALLSAANSGDLVSGSPWASDAEELLAEIEATLAEAVAAQQEALAQAEDAMVAATEARNMILELGDEYLEAQQAIAEQLAGLETGDLAELRGIASAGLVRGWCANPSFIDWTTGDMPENWTVVTPSLLTMSMDGYRGRSVLLTVPSGSASSALRAASNIEGQLLGADPLHEYVVVAVRMRVLSGSLVDAGSRLRAEWRQTGTENWVRGHAFGQNNALGELGAQWGMETNPQRIFAKEVVFQRPTGSFDAVRVSLIAAQAANTGAVTTRIELLDIRPASEPEIDAHLAGDRTDAKIVDYNAELTSTTGAIATAVNGLAVTFGGNLATTNSTVYGLTGATEALAGRLNTIEAAYDGANLVRNPNVDLDGGPLAWGAKPSYYHTWPSGFAVVARGEGGGAALASAPTPFVVELANDQASHETVVRTFGAEPGEMFAVSFSAAGRGNSINFDVQARMTWRDATGAQIGSIQARTINITNAAWQSPVFEDFVAPAGTATGTLILRRPAGGSANGGYWTTLKLLRIDKVSRAKINEAATAASNANEAVATLSDTLTARIGLHEASTAVTASAVATIDGKLGSMWALRQKAGEAAGVVEAVVASNPTGPAVSQFKVGYDNIVLDGRVLIGRDLVVSDLSNKVPDAENPTSASWTMPAGWDTFTPENQMRGRASLRFSHPSGSSGTSTIAWSPRFTVNSGSTLFVEYQSRSSAAGEYRMHGRVRWITSSGTTTTELFRTDHFTAGGTRNSSHVLNVPSDAVECQIGFSFNLSETTASPIRVGSILAREQMAGNTHITPDSIHSSNMTANSITAREVNFASLQAVEAWISRAMIENLAVNTIKIGAAAVSNIHTSASIGTMTIQTDGGQVQVFAPSSSVQSTNGPYESVNAFASIEYRQGTSGDWTTLYSETDTGSSSLNPNGTTSNYLARAQTTAGVFASQGGVYQIRRRIRVAQSSSGGGLNTPVGPMSTFEFKK